MGNNPKRTKHEKSRKARKRKKRHFQNSTEKRKYHHIKIAKEKRIEFLQKSTGFNDIDFIHNALPEMNFNEVNTETMMFGKHMDAPIIIEAITGGCMKGGKINKRLATAAQKMGVAMGLGSMRAMIEIPSLTHTYLVRDVAPDIPLIGNIGIAQAINLKSRTIDDALKDIDADAVAVHLNTAQEIIQPEGDHDFKGGLETVERICKEVSVPVIVKEVGAGISDTVAHKLKRAGVRMLDSAGAGGSSWTRLEYYRNPCSTPGFEEWGIPTTLSILMCSRYLPTIASGGVRSGIDVAKSIALGAHYAGAALPFIKTRNPEKTLELWRKQLAIVMFLTGSKTLKELNKAKVMISGKTAQLLRYALG